MNGAGDFGGPEFIAIAAGVIVGAIVMWGGIALLLRHMWKRTDRHEDD